MLKDFVIYVKEFLIIVAQLDICFVAAVSSTGQMSDYVVFFWGGVAEKIAMQSQDTDRKTQTQIRKKEKEREK